jgi:transcriptional regulator with GAF, ATPase, and Fis domain
MVDKHLRKLYELIELVVTRKDLERLPELVLDAAMEVAGAERGFLVLVDGEICAARRLDAQARVSRTVLDRVLASRHPLLLRDADLDSESLREQRVRAVLAVPLRTTSGAVGAIYLDHRGTGAFREADLDLLGAFAAQAALALDRARRASAPRRAPQILGTALRRTLELVEKFAPLPYPVLVVGETGTGKELVARALHRRAGPFVAANVSAVPAALFESELFGHERGAFTGAEGARPGLFEQAHGGTLFLDEINSLAPDLQEKLLRVLQEREVRRVGGTRVVAVDARLVAAANESLERIPFRRDLFHRLNVLRIELPPLRERREDIPELAAHFVERIARETGRRVRLATDALPVLAGHDWPGNVRELENALRRAAATADGCVLHARDFRFLSDTPPPATGLVTVDDYIRSSVAQYGPALGLGELARRLGLSRKALWAMRKRWEEGGRGGIVREPERDT